MLCCLSHMMQFTAVRREERERGKVPTADDMDGRHLGVGCSSHKDPNFPGQQFFSSGQGNCVEGFRARYA